jgi:2-oxoglutarate ferredoxin oxidoreductase subunit alpha
VIGVPLTEMCNEAYTDPRERQLLKNIMYVWARSVLLEVDADVIEKLLAEQYKGKEQADGNPTRTPISKGYDYAKAHLPECDRPTRAPLGQRRQTSIFMEGNAAAALGRSMAAQPSAPGTRSRRRRRWPRRSRSYCSKLRVDKETGKNNFAIVQAEDELASIGMVVGAGWNGARAFTATSGPGVSLMTEFIGLAYFAEIPVTIHQRAARRGPSTGMPTRTQQADLVACAYASHGDTKHVLLCSPGPARMLPVLGCCTRSGRPPADTGVRHDRPGHRHESAPDCKPLTWDETKATTIGAR